MKLQVAFTNITRQSGGIESCHANFLNEKGERVPNASITISAPTTAGIGYQLETDIPYTVEINAVPTQEPKTPKK